MSTSEKKREGIGRPAFRVRPVALTLTVNTSTKRTLRRIAKEKGTSVSRMLDDWAQSMEEAAA